MTIINAETAPPESAKKSLFENKSMVCPPNVVSMVDSKVSMETQAAARLTHLEAVNTGL